MKVKIYETTKVEKEVDLNLPIYSTDDYSDDYGYCSCYSYSKLSECKGSLRVDTITLRNGNEVNVESTLLGVLGINSKYLGEGEHRSTKEDFEAAVSKALSLIKEVL